MQNQKISIPPLQKLEQLQLKLHYQGLKNNQEPLPDIDEVGFRVFSQNDEDGILLFIFSIIGWTNRLCLEIGAGNGIENNTTNLIINHNFHGLLIDGSEQNMTVAKQFFQSMADTRIFPPYLLQAMVSSDNVNDIVKPYFNEPQIDLFSLDIDSIDYYVFDALDVVNPRVVVVETPTICGPDKAKVVPNDSKYNLHNNANFYGASLAAYTKLAEKKGYRLLGVSRYGTNAFFIQNDLAKGLIPTKAVKECFNHPRAKQNIISRWEKSKDEPWVDV